VETGALSRAARRHGSGPAACAADGPGPRRTGPLAERTRQLARSLALALLAQALVARADDIALPEITVTAERREQSLQEAPVAVTAITREEIDALRIGTLADLGSHVPNAIVVPTVGGSVNAAINVRGASSTVNNLSRDAAVGVYLDGVPIGKASGALFDVADLSRIEVLRGPQGTLYGKNTIGGAINLISVRPSGVLGGETRLVAGNADLRQARTHLDTPAIGEVGSGAGQLAARFSTFRKLRDGFVDNEHPSSADFDNQDQWSTRAALRWEFDQRLSADYAHERIQIRQRPTALQVVELGSYRSLPLFGPIAAAAWSPRRLDAISNEASLRSDVGIRGDTLTFDYDLGDHPALGAMALKYIGGRRALDTASLTDFDGTAADFSRFGLFNRFEQRTHELQWLGTRGRISTIAGLFHYTDDWSTDNPRWNAQILRGMDGVNEINQRDAVDSSSAVFSQIDWRATDWLSLGVGLRWTRETKDVNRLRVTDSLRRGTLPASNPASGVFLRDDVGNAVFDANGRYQALNARKSFSETTPLLVANARLDEDVDAYLRVATGFKSGGYNDVASTNAEFLQGFDSETMRSVEVGLKSLWADRRVRLNLAAFHNDYRDYQADVYVPEALGIGVQNAASATSAGLELELSAMLTDHLELSLDYGYLDFRFDTYLTPDNYDVNGNGDRTEIIDVKDSRVGPYTMRHNGAAGLHYRRDLGFGSLRASVDYDFRGRHTFSSDPATALTAGPYGLWNASVGLTRLRLREGLDLSLDLWCRNAFDKPYLVNGLVFVSAYPTRGMAVGTFGDARSFGLEIAFEY